MSAAKFILDKPHAETPTHIFLMVTLSDGRLKYSTKKKVLPKHWNEKAQRATVTIHDAAMRRELVALNNRLATLDLSVNKYLKECLDAGQHSYRAELSARLDKIVKPEKIEKPKDFFEVLAEVYQDMKEGRILTKGNKRYKPLTLKSLNHTINLLKDYQLITGDRLAFEKISMNTYKGIVSHFNKDRKLALNSMGNLIKNLKTFLRVTYKAGIHQNQIFRDEDFKIMREDTFDVYLTNDDLEALYALELTGLNDIVRDWFLIDCYTGLRISDIQGLTDRDVQEWSMVSVNDKTGERVVIPIHQRVRTILAKYGGKLPRKTADQVINRYIKVIAKKAGITDRVDYVVTRGGNRDTQILEKWQMVSNHTARRTFITNLLKAGVETTSVMHMAGIREFSTLMRYNKRTVEETAEIMKGHDYFK